MSCEALERTFQERLTTLHQQLNDELQAIANDTEHRAQQIASDFEADNDLAAGVGAATGAAIGTAAGPGGVLVGTVIGRTIGSLFTLEVETYRHTIVLDVPQTSLQTRSFGFDVPSVRVSDRDITFDVPTTEMRRQRGPSVPQTTVRMRNKCVNVGFTRVCTKVPQTVVEWVPTYLNVPVVVMRTHRIVVGVPTVRMERQDVKVDVPEISMKPTAVTMDVPRITLRYIKDAGQRTAALTAALAQSAQEETNERRMAFRDRMRTEVAPLALAMFNCHRETLLTARSAIMERFSPQIATLTDAITALASRNVPADSPEMVTARDLLNQAIRLRDEALANVDRALADLEVAVRAAMDQFLADDDEPAPEKGLERFGRSGLGSLITFVPA